MTTYSDFKNQVLDKGFNIDGYAGYQCWDGYAKYCQYLGVPYANCTTSGYVKDIWTNRHTNGMLQNFDEVSTMEPGDIAVFKVDSDWTPYSHIAIFDSDAGGGYGWFLGQNQGGKYSHPDGGSSFNLVKLPYYTTFDTAFRPKKTVAKQSKKESTTPKTKSIEGADMYFTFTVDGDKNWNKGTVYYYNGSNNTIKGLSHPDEWKIIKEMFKESTGRDMPHKKWTSKAPWYVRFIGATGAKRV